MEGTASNDPTRVQEAFAEASELPTLSRPAFLASLRAESPSLAHEVESLLAYHGPGGVHAEADPTVSLPATLIGRMIGGCTIERLVGYGGMSAVYSAAQEFPRRRVAVKIVRRERMTASARRRLRVEAEALARLAHPNIARVFSAGSQRLSDRSEDTESPFIIMELIDGAVPLNTWANERRLDARARIGLVSAVADAIAHAHRAGVIHRDIKPGNVIVGPDGVPKVIDFGIAAVQDSTVTEATDGPMGTLAYMSPEQARGKQVDTRSDIWGLGALLYDMLAGTPPFEAEDNSVAARLDRLLHDSPAPVAATAARLAGSEFAAGIPAGCDDVLRKALTNDPEHRYRSAAEFADELRRLAGGGPLIARPDSEWTAALRVMRRHRTPLAAAAGVFVVTIAALVVSLALLRRESAANTRAQWSAYIASISAASSMLERGDASAASDILAAAPREHRGWEWDALRRLTDQSAWSIAFPRGQQVYGVDFSPDGTTLFAAASGWVSAIDVASRAERWRVGDIRSGGHFAEPAWRVKALRGGDAVALLFDGAVVRLDGVGHAVAYGSLPETRDLALDASRTRMFGSAPGGAVEIDPGTLAIIRRIDAVPPLTAIPRSIAVDAQAELIVIGDRDGVISALGAADGSLRWSWRTSRRGEEIRATAVSPDGTRVAAAFDSGIVVLDRASGAVIWDRPDRVQGYRSCMFTPDGSEVVASAWAESVDRFEAATGAPVASLRGAFSQVWQSAVSPDGRLIASGTFGERVEVFDATASSAIDRIGLDGSAVTAVAAPGAGRSVFATTANGALFAISGATATRIAIDGGINARAVCALPSGELAVAHDGGVAWISHDGRVLRTAPTERPATAIGPLARGALVDVRIGGDAADNGMLVCFDSATATELWRTGGFTASGGVACDTAREGVVFLPCGSGGHHRILDMRSGVESEPITLAEYPCSAELAPDGKRVAIGCVARAGEVTIVDGADFSNIAQLANHRGTVRVVRWSRDGSRIASASLDGTVRVWHADRGIELVTVWRDIALDLAWDERGTLWIAGDDGALRAMRVQD